MVIESYVESLLDYGQARKLFEGRDRVCIRNALIDTLRLETYAPPDFVPKLELFQILGALLDDAVARGLIENTATQRDLFDTKLMGQLMPRPSAVSRKFREEYDFSPRRATDFFYDFSQNTNYIRTDRIKKDLKWAVATEYGELEISINLAKPEKDPLEIALAKNAPATDYPKCALCTENEGFSGSAAQAARQTHRLIPISLGGEDWYFQYSPYVYYNEHCIALDKQHRPMKTSRDTFVQLFDFVSLFPHYFIGANADLPIVGGSILGHDHFQGGRYVFPMMRAPVRQAFRVRGYEEITVGMVNWPVTTLRLIGENRYSMIELAAHIFDRWAEYDCPEAGVYACTDGVRHNAVTPILRREGDSYVLDIALRNNLTSAERPFGVFHPNSALHHIKKENIGLIEVMGLAILPARLKTELEGLKGFLLRGEDPKKDETVSKHADWALELAEKYDTLSQENLDGIFQKELGYVFKQVLEDTGVFKRNKQGDKFLSDFISTL